MTVNQATQRILDATGRQEIGDALGWLAEQRPLRGDVPSYEVLAALTVLSEQAPENVAHKAVSALRVTTRRTLQSAVDPSVEILGFSEATPPAVYRAALDDLANYTASHSLRDVTAAAVHAALAVNRNVTEALCALTGLSYRDLVDRAPLPLPSDPTGTWSVEQVDAAFDVFDAIVRGTLKPALPGAIAARPVEMLFGTAQGQGWDLVEQLRTQGVPYEVLLTQRAVGGAWLAHRSSTANRLPALVLERLTDLLKERGISFSQIGADGMDKTAAAEKIAVGSTIGQVTMVVHADETPVLAVAVSVARDGGTARKNGGKLKDLPAMLNVPVAVVVVGPGWGSI